jgi:hypothetical protein
MIRREFLTWIGKIAGGYLAVKTLPPLLRINTSLLAEANAACANAQTCGARDCCATLDNCGAGDTTGHTCSEKDICNLDMSNNCINDDCSMDKSNTCNNDTCVSDETGACENDICRRDMSGACQSDRCARDQSAACISDRCLSDSSGSCSSDGCTSDKSGYCQNDQCLADKSGPCKTDVCQSDSSGSCSNDSCATDKSGACQNDQCQGDNSDTCSSDSCTADSSGACVSDQCKEDNSTQCKNDTCTVDNRTCPSDTTCVMDGNCPTDALCIFDGVCLLDGFCPTDGLSSKNNPLSGGSQRIGSDRSGRSQWAMGPLNSALNWLYRMSAFIIFLTLTLARHSSEAAVFTVPSGDTSALISAINSANANAEDDTINLAAGTYSLTLFDPEVDIAGLSPVTGVITINGSSTGVTVIERSAAADPFRIFYVTSTGDLRLNRLILRGGSAATGGAILNQEGKLSLTSCSVSGNTLSDAVDPCGGGGAITNFFGTVSLNSSSIFNNSGSCEETASGGGVENIGGNVAITNSTVYGNSLVSNAETAAGGGVSNIGGNVNIMHATISGNSVLSNDVYGEGNVGSGGGVYGSMAAKNTIFALNTATIAPDIAGGNVSLGHNLFDDLTGSLITLTTGDLTGPAGLGSFTNTGLPGHAFLPLLASSQTIDAADPADFSPADQLGVTRPQFAGPDIGAIERTNAPLPTLVTAAVTGISQTTATSGGKVTSDGGSAVTARGVCWGTSANPAVSGSHTTNGSGTGSFLSAISGLSPLTSYHVRAYATNLVGTAYGEDISFTTNLCASDVQRGGTSYWTIQDAITIGSGAEITAVARVFPEALLFTNGSALALNGGYACGFGSASGLTTVHGTITIAGSGAVALSNLAVY